MEEKKEIRKKIFKARKEHSDEWIQEKSRVITETLTALPEYKEAERIMAYADYNHEVITRYIIEQAWKDGKEVAVPKVFGKDMVFYKLTDFSQLESGYFGIPEPKEDGETVSWEDAMMVMPGVAFDVNCNRVGYGGGLIMCRGENPIESEKVDSVSISFNKPVLLSNMEGKGLTLSWFGY